MHRLLLPALFSASMALAADAALLNLIMPDAGLIAGVNVERTGKTRIGETVFARLPANDDSFQAFKAATGFDPQRDLHEVVIATPDGPAGNREGVMLVRGRFDLDRIRPFLAALSGVKREPLNGVDVYFPAGSGPKAFAFLSPILAIAGEADYVRSAVVSGSRSAVDPALAAKALELSASQDVWFVTRNHSVLAAGLDDKRVQGAVNGELFKSIDQSSGGIVFGEVARFSGQAVLKNEQDATSMAEVAKFLFNLVQAQGVKGAIGELVSAVSGFDASANGNHVNVVFSIPEAKLENLINARKSTASIQGK